jgi:hypothetical protein
VRDLGIFLVRRYIHAHALTHYFTSAGDCRSLVLDAVEVHVEFGGVCLLVPGESAEGLPEITPPVLPMDRPGGSVVRCRQAIGVLLSTVESTDDLSARSFPALAQRPSH